MSSKVRVTEFAQPDGCGEFQDIDIRFRGEVCRLHVLPDPVEVVDMGGCLPETTKPDARGIALYQARVGGSWSQEAAAVPPGEVAECHLFR